MTNYSSSTLVDPISTEDLSQDGPSHELKRYDHLRVPVQISYQHGKLVELAVDHLVHLSTSSTTIPF